MQAAPWGVYGSATWLTILGPARALSRHCQLQQGGWVFCSLHRGASEPPGPWEVSVVMGSEPEQRPGKAEAATSWPRGWDRRRRGLFSKPW